MTKIGKVDGKMTQKLSAAAAALDVTQLNGTVFEHKYNF